MTKGFQKSKRLCDAGLHEMDPNWDTCPYCKVEESLENEQRRCEELKAMQLDTLRQGVEVWNQQRQENPNVQIDLSHEQLGLEDLTGVNLAQSNLEFTEIIKVNFSKANFTGANLFRAYIIESVLTDAIFKGANLQSVDFVRTHLAGTDFTDAKLDSANLSGADLKNACLKGASLNNAMLIGANLQNANLSGANLTLSSLVGANLKSADLTNCRIHGISAWDLILNKETIQSNLIITSEDDATLTVENIEIAQFIYLILNNEKLRDVIDTITSKVVLILGCFSSERKAILDAIREELRHYDCIPVIFDFEGPKSKDITGTIETLARMARFIIADLTNPSSIPHELATIVPFLRTTPVIPIKLLGSEGYGMFDDYEGVYPWVMETHEYKNEHSLTKMLSKIIVTSDKMAKKLRHEK